MIILMSALEWVQSFQGITTISIGGISLGGIVGFVVYAVKSANTMKGVGDLVKVIKDSKAMLDEEREKSAMFKSALDERDLEVLQQKEINNLLLTGLSVIVASSSGIDSVSKIEMVNEMQKAKERLLSAAKETAKETLEVVKEEAKVKTMEVLDAAVKQATTIFDKYSKK